MPKPDFILLATGEQIPILHEDRSVLALDKPRNWMLVPFSWQKTNRNLQAALTSSIGARDFWARSRNVRFLRFIHRLDAETTGILLFGKSAGAVTSYGRLFESRQMEKVYLAVVQGRPKQDSWVCRLKLSPDARPGRMKAHPRHGKDAETSFKVLQSHSGTALIAARPLTGRTHQIRVHLAESGHPVVGDELYGSAGKEKGLNLGLRAVTLSYRDPFTRRDVRIEAPVDWFLREYGFGEQMVQKR
jgi:RluA family pseudouridine synthase